LRRFRTLKIVTDLLEWVCHGCFLLIKLIECARADDSMVMSVYRPNKKQKAGSRTLPK
jgi:hypothetical protein